MSLRVRVPRLSSAADPSGPQTATMAVYNVPTFPGMTVAPGPLSATMVPSIPSQIYPRDPTWFLDGDVFKPTGVWRDDLPEQPSFFFTSDTDALAALYSTEPLFWLAGDVFQPTGVWRDDLPEQPSFYETGRGNLLRSPSITVSAGAVAATLAVYNVPTFPEITVAPGPQTATMAVYNVPTFPGMTVAPGPLSATMVPSIPSQIYSPEPTWFLAGDVFQPTGVWRDDLPEQPSFFYTSDTDALAALYSTDPLWFLSGDVFQPTGVWRDDLPEQPSFYEAGRGNLLRFPAMSVSVGGAAAAQSATLAVYNVTAFPSLGVALGPVSATLAAHAVPAFPGMTAAPGGVVATLAVQLAPSFPALSVSPGAVTVTLAPMADVAFPGLGVLAGELPPLGTPPALGPGFPFTGLVLHDAGPLGLILDDGSLSLRIDMPATGFGPHKDPVWFLAGGVWDPNGVWIDDEAPP